jgi:hypothetical protein
MIVKADEAKCEGIGCAYKDSCGRYLRPDAWQQQVWGSYYALEDDDCAYFEVVIKND